MIGRAGSRPGGVPKFLAQKPLVVGGSGTVSFDAWSNSLNSGVSSPVSWTYTPIGIPTGVAVFVQVYSVPVGNTLTSTDVTVTYGGVPMTLAVTLPATGLNTALLIFGLTGPPSGPQTIVVAYSPGSYWNLNAVSVTGGVTSGSPFSNTAAATASNTGPTSVNVASAIGELVADMLGTVNTNTLSVTSGQTQLGNAPTGYATVGVSTKAGAAPSVTTSWTFTGGSTEWQALAVSFKAASGTAPSSISGTLSYTETFDTLAAAGTVTLLPPITADLGGAPNNVILTLR